MVEVVAVAVVGGWPAHQLASIGARSLARGPRALWCAGASANHTVGRAASCAKTAPIEIGFHTYASLSVTSACSTSSTS